MHFLAAVAVLAATLTPGALAAQGTAPAPIVPGGCAVAPAPSAQNTLVLDLSTGGRVLIAMRPDVAPKMVERVTTLTRQHFYDGLVFHRVIDGFMAQGGDPKGDGTGGSPLPNVAAEFNCLPHVRGAVSAARAEDKNSANSQFFIVFQPKLSLDKKYTVFGRVTDGMQWVDAIERGEPPETPSRIVHAYILGDNPPPYQPGPPAVTPTVTLPLPTGPSVAAPKPAPKATARRRAPARRR